VESVESVEDVEDETGLDPVDQDDAGAEGADTGGAEEAGAVDGPDATDDPNGEDGPGSAKEESEDRDPLRFNNWMKRSATGAVMTGIAVGLQQALQLPRQEPAFVIEASGEPHDPNRAIDLHFDPDNPADTVAVIRRPAAAEAPEDPSAPA
jgi:hypothetical protein